MELDSKKVELSAMYAELLLVKKMLASLKEDLDDRFLTAEEIENVKIAEEEHRNGETCSLYDLKRKIKNEGR